MLVTVLRVEAAVFLVGVVLLVGYRMLTGQVNTRGLLVDKDTKQLSIVRLQLLVATIFGAAYWLIQVLQQPTMTAAFPDVPQDLLALFAGSHSVYLAGKSLPLLRQK